MSVLSEMLVWSRTRPLWQRDALRRLLTQARIESKDIAELGELCKAPHGLSVDAPTAIPLEAEHIPSAPTAFRKVKLTSVTHVANVNALAPNQTVQFGSALTVVYGGNGAGKSGYTRILKQACRARGSEPILGNVLGGRIPGKPTAVIKYTANGSEEELTWTEGRPVPPDLSQVSVFDTHCAAVYVREKTDVAYRPMGLDLFDRLSDLCVTLRAELESARRAIETDAPPLPRFPEGTAVHRCISGLSSLTDSSAVRDLALFENEDEQRLKEIEVELSARATANADAMGRVLGMRASRLRALRQRLEEIQRAMQGQAAKAFVTAQADLSNAEAEFEKAHVAVLNRQPLKKTGSPNWRAMWEAARGFSERDAYPGEPFPFTGGESRCLLCQQDLGDEAGARLDALEETVRSARQQQVDRARHHCSAVLANFEATFAVDEAISVGVDELRLEDPALCEDLDADLAEVQKWSAAAVDSAATTGTIQSADGAHVETRNALDELISRIEKRAANLRNPDPDRTQELDAERAELTGRQILNACVDTVLDAIERKKRLAAYSVCIQDTGTQGITRKSTEVTKKVVSESLAGAFTTELERLGFHDLDVEIRPAGGERGALFHQLSLRGASGVHLPKVASEGESRCLALAAFLSELATADDLSGIIFDDPVSSLDHSWRENVARRLAEEARQRQVVVFTHDIVFLLALVTWAETVGVDFASQYVRHELAGAGVSARELPWPALKVKDRIGKLKAMWQAAEKVQRVQGVVEYEQHAMMIYGLLREAWERAFEEVLLNGVLERYRKSVETQRARALADITAEDCAKLETAMSKCSRWLPGHDQAPAELAAIPGPEELRQDIRALEDWVSEIRGRRR